MKKLVVIISSLIFIFILFLFFYFKKNTYTLEYKINDIFVKESFNKDKEYYLFELNYNGEVYAFLTFDKYTSKRKLIDDIKVNKEDDITCLEISAHKIKAYSVCKDSTGLINTKISRNENSNTYANYTLNDLNNKTYLLWNYHNFIYLSPKTQKEIKLFAKDEYTLNLVTTYQKYLVVANIESGYTFNKLYLINKDNGKVEEIKLRYDLYYNDTYFLGTYKNKLYLYDKKQEQEYYINMNKKKIYKTNNKTLVDNKWEDISTYKLKNNQGVFQYSNVYNYEVINNNLYAKFLDYQVKISDLKVKNIIKTNNLDVYFLSDNILYFYNPYEGLKVLISYPEWDFNYQNMIYIFD